ncbi:BTB/POZ domain-containing protein [Rhizophagus irregularis DAOM 181602=DAOM 197198]|nr:BTB/POZ domain-containing protein [Rhizophagus irregularis DAOM 181602=DAOM 197198]
MYRLLKTLKFKADDVIIHVGEEPDIKEFRSYSKTLCNKSDYFKKRLSDENIEKEDGYYVIKIPNINSQIFEIIIKNLNGTDDLNRKTGVEILNIIITSDDLKLYQLAKQAEEFFIKNRQCQLLRNDPVGILKLVLHHKILSKIQEFCLETICSEPEILFNSDDFIDLPAPILEIILRRNDLKLIEIKIWENLIKWGKAQEAQEKTLDEDNQEKLKRFTPLIRFYDISSEDYFNKVKPIIPKELQEEILKFHMIPEYKPTLVNFLPRHKNNFQSANVANSKGDQYSVRCRSHCGPYFGYRDLYVNHNENDKNPDIWNSWYERSYPTLNLPNTFVVDDYEVFQVIKK